MDPLSIASIGLGVAQAGMGLFDNSAAKEAHAQNKARAKALERQNDRTHFENLKIGAQARREQALTNQRLADVALQRDVRNMKRQRDYDDNMRNALVENQSDAIKMFRSMRGNQGGRMNLDSSGLSKYQRASAIRRNQLMRSADDQMTSGYLARLDDQRKRNQIKARVAGETVYTPYQTDYEAVKAPDQTMNKLMNFAIGAGQAVVGGMALDKQLNPPDYMKTKTLDDIQVPGTPTKSFQFGDPK